MHKNAHNISKRKRRPFFGRRRNTVILLQKRYARMFAERKGFRIP